MTPTRPIDERMAETLKALAHPLRIAILQLLRKEGTLPVGDICKRLRSEQSLTSHHLKHMRLSGLLEASRAGKQVFYAPRKESIEALITFLYGLVPSK